MSSRVDLPAPLALRDEPYRLPWVELDAGALEEDLGAEADLVTRSRTITGRRGSSTPSGDEHLDAGEAARRARRG